jgi:hypothetical protein
MRGDGHAGSDEKVNFMDTVPRIMGATAMKMAVELRIDS